jgi:predicted HicB family RNase H-like nuclease
MLTYKDYIAKISFDEDENIFHGEIINLRDVITFQGSSVDELKKEFIDSVDDYLEFCKTRNEKPDTPLNGYISLQIPLDTQKKLYNAAKLSGKEFDEWAVDTLQKQAVV